MRTPGEKVCSRSIPKQLWEGAKERRSIARNGTDRLSWVLCRREDRQIFVKILFVSQH